MNSTASQLLHPGDLPLCPCRTLLELGCADTGYYSGSDSLSPTSSIESCSLSSPSFQWAVEREALAGLGVGGPQAPARYKKRSRSKYPGKKRQSASEREKLRMRGLTRALHHLRTYLPPSVAPPGQTLTKIETLRLTIRYIGQLSAQLGLDEEARHGAAEAEAPASLSPPEAQEWCQCSCQLSSMPVHQAPQGTQGPPHCGTGAPDQAGADMLMSAVRFQHVQDWQSFTPAENWTLWQHHGAFGPC